MLHRFVKGQVADVSELRLDGQTSVDAAPIMEAKAQVWTRLWTPSGFDAHRALEALAEARRLARSEVFGPLTEQDLERALSSISPRKAKGIEPVGQ